MMWHLSRCVGARLQKFYCTCTSNWSRPYDTSCR